MEYLNLTNAQKRIWYMEKEYFSYPMYNIGGVTLYNEAVDFVKLQCAINLVILQNDNLRLRFCEQNNEPFQYVYEYKYEEFEFVDLSEKHSSIDEFMESHSRYKFTIENGRLYQFILLKISDNKGGYFINLHHIISDGWAAAIITDQIKKNYEMLCNNMNIDNEKKTFIQKYLVNEEKYLSSARFHRDQKFWIEEFKNYSNSRSLDVDTIEGKRKVFDIDQNFYSELKDFLKKNNLSDQLFWTFVYGIFENMHSDDKLVLGIPIFNRHSVAEKQMVAEFTNIMPLKTDIDFNRPALEAMIELSNYFFKCLKHSKYPYNLLQQNLQNIFKSSISIYNVCINCYEVEYSKDTIEFYNGFQPYKLQIVFRRETDNSKKLMFDYLISEYSESDIDEMFKRMMVISEKLIRFSNIPIKNICFLNEDEYNNCIVNYNNTSCEYPSQSTIVELFERSVELNKTSVAACFKNTSISYSELNEKANSLASLLIKNGVKKGDVIGIMIDHSINILIAIFAILKTGAAYMPLDKNYPLGRLAFMIDESKVKLIVTDFSRTDLECDTLDIRHFDYSCDSMNINVNISPDDLVYIIYTSGSTGKPKGVRITHRGLVNYISWASKHYMEKNEVFALYSSFSFDLTVTSIFTPLISGNRIEIYSDDEDEYVLYRILRENKCTIVKLTPAHLALIKDLDNSKCSINKFIVGGDNLNSETAAAIYESFNGKIRIFNEYGPTETVVGCMIYEYDNIFDRNTGSVSIGKPISNMQIYLLDKNLNPVPEGVVGEIYISGVGVSPGYINRDSLNEKVFLSNPFLPDLKMYKSGDLGIFFNNNIRCLGRADNQVKINGHRIELGEIETRLKDNCKINDAIVWNCLDKSGNSYLCAYIIEAEHISDDELIQYLRSVLPHYMIPRCYLRMDAFPLTVNGKIDYKKLPEYTFEVSQKDISVNYNDPYLKIIIDVLNVNIDDLSKSFYEYGGDSIKAIQISGRVREIGAVLKVKDIQNSGSIMEILSCIQKDVNGESSKDDSVIYNTPILQWYIDLKLKNMNYFCQSIFVVTEQNISKDVYSIIFDNIIEKHEMLHLRYNEKEKNFFISPDTSYAFNYISLSEISLKEELMKKCAIDARKEINIINGPVFSVVVFGDNGKDHIFMAANHAAVDGVSWRIILSDIILQLKQYNNNQTLQLTGKTSKFATWSKYISNYSVPDSELEYWKYSMNGGNASFIKQNDVYSDVNKTKLEYSLDRETTELLFNIQENPYNVSVEEMLVTSLLLCIAEKSKINDVSIEMEHHGRSDNESNIVGWFTSMFVLRSDIFLNDIEKSLLNVKKQIRTVPENGIGYGVALYLNRSLEKKQRYIRFNYLGNLRNTFENTCLKKDPIDMGEDTSTENITDSLMDINCICFSDKLLISLVFDKNECDVDSIKSFCEKFIKNIKDTVEFCNKKNENYIDVNDYGIDISQDELDNLFG